MKNLHDLSFDWNDTNISLQAYFDISASTSLISHIYDIEFCRIYRKSTQKEKTRRHRRRRRRQNKPMKFQSRENSYSTRSKVVVNNNDKKRYQVWEITIYQMKVQINLNFIVSMQKKYICINLNEVLKKCDFDPNLKQLLYSDLERQQNSAM